MLRKVILLTGLLIAAFVWTQFSRPPAPAAAAAQFLDALTYRDCPTALALLAAEDRFAVERAAQGLTHATYEDVITFENERYCRPSQLDRFRGLSAHGIRIARRGDEEAVLEVKRREATAYLIPGFWGTKYRVRLEEMRMVREDGAWRVRLP